MSDKKDEELTDEALEEFSGGLSLGNIKPRLTATHGIRPPDHAGLRIINAAGERIANKAGIRAINKILK